MCCIFDLIAYLRGKIIFFKPFEYLMMGILLFMKFMMILIEDCDLLLE